MSNTFYKQIILYRSSDRWHLSLISVENTQCPQEKSLYTENQMFKLLCTLLHADSNSINIALSTVIVSILLYRTRVKFYKDCHLPGKKKV